MVREEAQANSVECWVRDSGDMYEECVGRQWKLLIYRKFDALGLDDDKRVKMGSIARKMPSGEASTAELMEIIGPTESK